jgi:hypothetical protein
MKSSRSKCEPLIVLAVSMKKLKSNWGSETGKRWSVRKTVVERRNSEVGSNCYYYNTHNEIATTDDEGTRTAQVAIAAIAARLFQPKLSSG